MTKLQDRLRSMARMQRHADYEDAILCREAADMLDECERTLEMLYDGLETYGPDYMHGLNKAEYVDAARRTLAKLEGAK